MKLLHGRQFFHVQQGRLSHEFVALQLAQILVADPDRKRSDAETVPKVNAYVFALRKAASFEE